MNKEELRKAYLVNDILDLLADRPMSEGEIGDRLEEIGERLPPYEADEIYEELLQLRLRGRVTREPYEDRFYLVGHDLPFGKGIVEREKFGQGAGENT